MSWSDRFLAALEQPQISPILVLQRIEIDAEPGSEYSATTHAGYAGADAGALLIDPRAGIGVKIEGQTLAPTSWTSTVGAFSLYVAVERGAILRRLTRGTVCVLRMGFPGWAPADFARIAIGAVYQISRSDESPWYEVRFSDLWAVLRNRLAPTAPELFGDIGADQVTTLLGPYTVGDGTLNVTSNVFLDRDSGGYGAVKIIPTSGDDPFYLLWSAKPTGTSLTIYEASSEHYGTVRVNAAIGSTVQYCAHFRGHPMDLARKLLTSTGTATNGTYDTLPVLWGYGVPDHLIDHDDTNRYRAIVAPSSGSLAFDFVQEEEVTDGLSWMSDGLSRAGIFLAMRQGSLTVRAAQSTGSLGTLSVGAVATIRDRDIMRVERWEAWDESWAVEYRSAQVATATGTDSESADVATLPAQRIRTFDLSNVIWSNESAVRTEVLGRVGQSARSVPERLILLCAGLRLMALSPGDIVDLDTTRCFGRTEAAYGSTAYKPDYRNAMVIGVEPMPYQGVVRVTIIVYPASENAFD